MFRYIVKLIALGLLVLIISSLINHFFYRPLQLLPYSYSSDLIYLKSSYVKKNRDQYNTVFIGSSRVHREFDPILFDSITDSRPYTHSFNYGINWLASSELFYMLDNLVEKDSLPLKYALIELSKIKFLDYANIHSTRIHHWYNWENFWFTFKAALCSNSSFPFRLATALTHVIGMTDKQLNLGYISDLNDFHQRSIFINDSLKKMSNEYTGFTGLSGFKNNSLNTKEENVTGRMKKFLADTSGLVVLRKASAMQFKKYEDHPELMKKFNKVYLKKINQTIEQLRTKGIYPVFVLTPRYEKNQYDEVIPLFHQIDSNYKIEIADSRKYPELYIVENSGDETHLNIKGAKIFTSILAREFKKLVESNETSKK